MENDRFHVVDFHQYVRCDDIEKIIAQRDELLEAMKGMIEAFDHGTENEEWAQPFIRAAHAAIAKCEVKS